MKLTLDKIIKGLIFATIVSLLSILFTTTKAFRIVDRFNYDYVLEKSNDNYNNDIKIIAIDEKSINELGKYDTWTRAYYAQVIENLITYNPSAIVLDVLFTGDAPNTDKLVTAINHAKEKDIAVIFAAKIEQSTTNVGKIDLVLPYESIYNALGEEGIGYASSTPDDDSYVRKIPLTLEKNVSNDKEIGLLSYQAALAYANRKGIDVKNYKNDSYYYIDYTGKDCYYENPSFVDIYNNEDLGFDEDGVYFIGGYASALNDEYFVPITHKKMFGVEIHANICDALLEGNLRVEANLAVQAILNFIILFALAFFIFNLRFLFASIATASTVVALYLLELLLYGAAKVYYPFIGVIIIAILTYIAGVVYNYIKEKMAKGSLVRTFKQYMAPQVVESFVKNPNAINALEVRTRNVACLFVDVRGFTKMSSTLTPDEVVEILNEYLGMCAEEVFKNDGMVDKFIGDCCMALFNAPLDTDDYLYKSIKAGMGITNRGKPICEKFSKKFSEKYNKEITIGLGVGVNIGDAVVGNIGCSFRMDYTAIGDTINTASRLESNAKAGQLVISDEVYELLKDRINVEDNGYLALKGKGDVHTYNVLSLKESEDNTNE